MKRKPTLKPVMYVSGYPSFQMEAEYRCMAAPMKCCMRCSHTEKVYSCREDDLLVCDVNNNAHRPADYCLSFKRR